MENQFGKYVVKQRDDDRWVRFAIDCDCSDNDHRMTFDMEVDKKNGDVSLTFYKDLYTYDKEWYPHQWYSDCKTIGDVVEVFVDRIKYHVRLHWSRIKRATSILFTGHSKFEGDFYMHDLEHIDELISALTYSRKKMIEGHDNFDSEKLKEYKDSLKAGDDDKRGSNFSIEEYREEF